MKKIIGGLVYILAFGLQAQAENRIEIPKECQKIQESCEKAGFVFGQKSENKAGRRHCLMPLLHGAKAEGGIPLPQVNATEVARCKKVAPDFGKGRES